MTARTSLEEGARDIARWMTAYKNHHEQHHPECSYSIFDARPSALGAGEPATRVELERVKAELRAWKAAATSDLLEAANMLHDLTDRVVQVLDEVRRLRSLLQP